MGQLGEGGEGEGEEGEGEGEGGEAELTPSTTQINLQENPLKSFLVSMFLSSLRSQIPPRQQPTYLLSHQSLEYLREPMGMTNKHVGYVFLVDWEGRIRWAGCGWASPEEEEGLRRCCWVLRDRLVKGPPAAEGKK